MPRYRCLQAQFTEHEFIKYQDSFWAMPNAWGEAGTSPSLATIWKKGGQGAISILPILGQFARAGLEVGHHLSKEELARLAGVSPDSVARGGAALADLGLVKESLAWRRGARLTKWMMRPELVGPINAAGEYSKDSYFFFPTRLVYGGNWARLSGVQRALYLAVASRSDTYRSLPREIEMLGEFGSPELVDLERCFEHNPAHPWVRLAAVSFAELARVSGVARSALQTAVANLRHPTVWAPDKKSAWRADTDNLRRLEFSPLAVYPTMNGNLIYHLRDHVQHWPWAVLNERHHDRSVLRDIKLALEA